MNWMIATRWLSAAALVVALPLAAQDTTKAPKPAPKKPTLEDAKTPSECSQAVQSAWDARYKAYRDKTKDTKPSDAERTAFFKSTDEASIADAKQCAARFDIGKIDRDQLPDLAS